MHLVKIRAVMLSTILISDVSIIIIVHFCCFVCINDLPESDSKILVVKKVGRDAPFSQKVGVTASPARPYTRNQELAAEVNKILGGVGGR